jgi:NTE family protein
MYHVPKNVKVALTLGGGGARGLAHVGVLKVLQREGIRIDMVVGTSIGAVAGAIFAQTLDAESVHQRFRDFLLSPEFKNSGLDLFRKPEAAENFFGQVATYVKERIVINLAHSRPSLVKSWRLQKAIERMVDEANIEELKLTFAAVAGDLRTGQEVVFTEGSVRQAVAASSSIPGFLPPVELDGMLLADGAIVSPVPVRPARKLGADLVIAVDVSQDLDPEPEIENVIDVVFRTNLITAKRYNALLLEQADAVIRPQVGQVHWSEFKRLEELVEEGARATKAALPQIAEAIDRRRTLWQKLVGG